MREGGQVNSEDNPSPRPLPTRSSRGEGEKSLGIDVTQGGARSSLALGYYQAIPTGFQFCSLRLAVPTDGHHQRPAPRCPNGSLPQLRKQRPPYGVYAPL